ncbi:hypothetical protein THIOSC15_990003 [uncultured Thiomicrorhabdus sp.]
MATWIVDRDLGGAAAWPAYDDYYESLELAMAAAYDLTAAESLRIRATELTLHYSCSR